MYTLADNHNKGPKVLQIHDMDNVGVVLVALQQGEEFAMGHTRISVLDDIAFGHKIALRTIRKDEEILKYGVPIGIATADISAGRHVHTHNMKSRHLDQFSARDNT